MKDVCLALNMPTTRKNQASASKLLFAQYPASRFRVLMTQTVANVSGTQRLRLWLGYSTKHCSLHLSLYARHLHFKVHLISVFYIVRL